MKDTIRRENVKVATLGKFISNTFELKPLRKSDQLNVPCQTTVLVPTIANKGQISFRAIKAKFDTERVALENWC
jgi:hypothetical protein